MQTGVRIITPESRRRDTDSSGAPGTREPGEPAQGPGGRWQLLKGGGLVRRAGGINEKL